MTLVAEPAPAMHADAEPMVGVAPVSAPARTQADESGMEAIVRATLLALLAVLSATLVWTAFDALVTPIWYRSHQQHLAADFAVERPGIAAGQASAVLQIPSIGMNVVVVEGDTPGLLREGPGHRIGTAQPGDLGNAVVEGHRTRWGAPFAGLDRLVAGSHILVQNRLNQPVLYQVTAIHTVDRAGLARWLQGSRDYRLTLVTSSGSAFAGRYLVVQAVSGVSSTRPPTGRAARAVAAGSPGVGKLGDDGLAGLLALMSAVVAGIWLSRAHRRLTVLAVVVPLLLAATLALVLAIDTGLPPLL